LSVDQANAVLVRAAGNDPAVTGLLSIRDLSENLTFGKPDAFEFYRLGVQLQTAAEQIAALLNGAAGVSASDVAGSFYQQLAAGLSAPEAPANDAILGNATAVSQLTSAIAASLGVTLDAGLLSGASQVITAAFGRIETIAFGTTALADVSRVQIVGQSVAANALHDAAAGVTPIGTVVGQFTGDGLNAAIVATPSPNIQLPPVEPQALETVITTLPDGTTTIAVTSRTSDPILDASGNPIDVPTEFELTVPVIPDKRLALTSLSIEANVEEGGPAFLEIRSSLDDYQTVVSRVATSLDTATYLITLSLPSSTSPVTLRIFAVAPVDPAAAFDFIKVIATGVLLPLNLAPTANDDIYVTNQNTPLIVAFSGVLANDTDVEGDALTAVLNSGPTHGTLTLNANGSFSYNATAGYTGSDSFTYRANDGTSLSTIATVTITIKQVSPPVVTAPASITIAATSAAGARASSSQLLAAFLASGSALDPTDSAPVRLTPQVNGVDVTSSTSFGIGTTAVTFRYRNSSGQIGTATSFVNVIVGTVGISTSVTGKGVDASGNYYVDLMFTNTGTGYAMNLAITESSFRTLTGTGSVSLLNPGTIEVGNLAAGTSSTIRILLIRPVSVKRFSYTVNMTLTTVTGVKLSASSSQAIIP
ncbi:MAG TPA: cadherin-like domain-containing protein, partial [Terriglobia bacterium]|nr:cadherin-like domain-containing protein [Terriglobia bacterium]